ncbi:hypothetical protein D3C71_1569380 [compost metagenome]
MDMSPLDGVIGGAAAQRPPWITFNDRNQGHPVRASFLEQAAPERMHEATKGLLSVVVANRVFRLEGQGNEGVVVVLQEVPC